MNLPKPKSDFVNVSEIRLHYLDWSGKGPTLIFLAGMGSSAYMFSRFAALFAGWFRVLALTRRGHGDSDYPETGYDADTLVEDIRQFMDQLQVEKAILIGHSLELHRNKTPHQTNMKRNFLFLMVVSVIFLSTSCMLSSDWPTVTPTFTSSIVLSGTPAATSTLAPTGTGNTETEEPVSTATALPTGDGGLLSGKPCESPCFFGVQLGETKLDQIIPSLNANGLLPCFQPQKFPDWKGVVCDLDDPRVAVGVHEDTLIVDEIGYRPSISFSVGDIIAKYGEPNHVQTVRTQDNSKTWPRNSNIWVMTAILYWDSLAMEVGLPPTKDTGGHSYQIESTTNAETIFFREEEEYIRNSREGSEAWHGYDSYASPLLIP